MQNFVNFLKENYSYFVYVIEFVLAIVGAVFAFVKSRRASDLETEKKLLSSKYFERGKKLSYYGLLPTMVRSANILYPVHGDGKKRFEYVYEQVRRILGCEDSQELRTEVFFAVQSILNADKLKKIPRDTQVIEPKKEFYEEKKDVSPERFAFVRKNGEEKQSD